MYQVGLIHDSNDFIETANPTLTEGVKPFQERKWNWAILPQIAIVDELTRLVLVASECALGQYGIDS